MLNIAICDDDSIGRGLLQESLEYVATGDSKAEFYGC